MIRKLKYYLLVPGCVLLICFVLLLRRIIFFEDEDPINHVPEPSIDCALVKKVAQKAKLFDTNFKFRGDGQKKRRTFDPPNFSEVSNVESWTYDQHRVWDGVKVNLYRYAKTAERKKMIRLLEENVLTDSHVRIYKYCEKEDVFVDEYLDGDDLRSFRICTRTPNFLERLRLLISVVQSVVDLNKRGIIYTDYKWTQWRQAGRDTKNKTHKFKLVDLEVN